MLFCFLLVICTTFASAFSGALASHREYDAVGGYYTDFNYSSPSVFHASLSQRIKRDVLHGRIDTLCHFADKKQRRWYVLDAPARGVVLREHKEDGLLRHCGRIADAQDAVISAFSSNKKYMLNASLQGLVTLYKRDGLMYARISAQNCDSFLPDTSIQAMCVGNNGDAFVMTPTKIMYIRSGKLCIQDKVLVDYQPCDVIDVSHKITSPIMDEKKHCVVFDIWPSDQQGTVVCEKNKIFIQLSKDIQKPPTRIAALLARIKRCFALRCFAS